MSGGDSNSTRATIRCTGADAVHLMVEEAKRFAAARRLSQAEAAKLAIVVEELVINLVDYGWDGEPGRTELVLDRTGDGIAIMLSDDGVAFDPRMADRDDAIPDRGGGAGINIIRAWADILDYRSEHGWNRIELRLRPV